MKSNPPEWPPADLLRNATPREPTAAELRNAANDPDRLLENARLAQNVVVRKPMPVSPPPARLGLLARLWRRFRG